jgi:hypothetical protein
VLMQNVFPAKTIYILQDAYSAKNLEDGRHCCRHSIICWFACCNTQMSPCTSQHMTTSASARV